jgi:Family of unknown function (DUF6184)
MRITSTFALLYRRAITSNSKSTWIAAASLVGLTCCSHDAREPEMQPASGTLESVRVIDGNTSVTIDRSGVPQNAESEPANPAPAAAALRDGVLTIIDGRCEAEMRCGNIGVSRKYETLAACQTSVGDSVRNHFETDECRANFDRQILEKCLTALRDDECNARSDPLTRIESCRTTAICTR